ncbi:MAG: hypothetical protein ACI94Y_001976, partial [Maribacter sp.]
MKRFIPFFIIISAILIFAGFTKEDNFTVDEETPIWQVLEH